MALLQLSVSYIGESPHRHERYTAPLEISSRLACSPPGLAAALTTYSGTPGCMTCGIADVVFTMKQYVWTDLEADRQVATTLPGPIIGGPPVAAKILRAWVRLEADVRA